MTESSDLHDVIGFWSELKLEIIEKYLPAYTTILSKQNASFRSVYIDAFAGSGTHISRQSGEAVAGSPTRALQTKPEFDEYHFIDISEARTRSLEELAAGRSNVYVHRGDCNEILLEKVFPRCRYEDYARAICFLDPYGLQLDWNVIATAGRMKSVEIFLNFPVMDINRNAIPRDATKERPKQSGLTRFWGDESWREAAYKRQALLFGGEELEKQTNDQFAEAFRERLVREANFKFVAEPLAMRNSVNAIVYYLFFASPNPTGQKIVTDILDNYRRKGFG